MYETHISVKKSVHRRTLDRWNIYNNDNNKFIRFINSLSANFYPQINYETKVIYSDQRTKNIFSL